MYGPFDGAEPPEPEPEYEPSWEKCDCTFNKNRRPDPDCNKCHGEGGYC